MSGRYGPLLSRGAPLAGLVLEATVGGSIGAAGIALNVGDPTDIVRESNSVGLAAIAAVFGAAVGSAAGMILGGAVWKFDTSLSSRVAVKPRLALEILVVTSITGLVTVLAFPVCRRVPRWQWAWPEWFWRVSLRAGIQPGVTFVSELIFPRPDSRDFIPCLACTCAWEDGASRQWRRRHCHHPIGSKPPCTPPQTGNGRHHAPRDQSATRVQQI
jgi:hypothetical protein